MKINSICLRGIRCFENTGDINLSRNINIFVGQNNAGKSTILKSITDFQLNPELDAKDCRPGYPISGIEIVVSEILPADIINYRPLGHDSDTVRIASILDDRAYPHQASHIIKATSPRIWESRWPRNFIIPFAAKRKASTFDQSVNQVAQERLNGTFSNLYARIDLLANPGRSSHEMYAKSVKDIVGVFITTKSSLEGKQGGYYFDDETFVTLDRMGDGVSEMVALIVDLSLAKNKTFVLEEPETNLHPKGLKALLSLIRESSGQNQFIIATHSNVVVRELTSPDTQIFRVFRDGDKPASPSIVELVEDKPEAHRELLRELGYEFGDFELHDGWLFLEESSAETVIRSILIPWFAPKLQTRLRTFSAGGVTNLEPSVSEFQRLITFVHLEPVYKDRLWVRADGDEPGRKMVEALRSKFKYLDAPRSDTFVEPQFEHYYPSRFAERVEAALTIKDKAQKRAAKATLLGQVVQWSLTNEAEARPEWEASAAEQIELLSLITQTLG